MSARFWASGRGVLGWHVNASNSSLRGRLEFSEKRRAEVLARGACQFGQGRDGGDLGADPGRALGELGWMPVAVCV